MLKSLVSRLRQGYKTHPFPAKEPVMPERFMGLPHIEKSRCSGCRQCVQACPAEAISIENNKIRLDLGRCIFCGNCRQACTAKAIEFSRDYRLSVTRRDDLVLEGAQFKLAQAIDEKSKAIFGRSLKLRQVSAGGCNACEADTNVLTTLVYDLGRFGIQFVASPRHADGILVTGPVTQNMQLAIKKTYDAVPSPKFVIAVGACAISGGLYRDNEQGLTGTENKLPVDLYIPGCPPHPYTILDGILRLLGRIEK